MSKIPSHITSRKFGGPLLLGVLLVFILIISVGYVRGRGSDTQRAATFAVFQDTMEVTVLEGGNVEARNSLQINSEVQGQTRILSLVEEGYMITPEDVENELVLVELDSKDLVDRQLSQELDYQNSLAALTEATEQYEIQLNQNESDITAAELQVHFARMDLERFLGESLAKELLEKYRPVGSVEETATASSSSGVIDFSQYAHPDRLGDGEARQKLRRLEDELALSEEEVGLAETTLEGTRRLFEREFVTQTQLDNDQMAHNRRVIAYESAQTSLDLFIKYEFPKEAQQLFSDYEEALRRLERVKKLAHSQLAQAEAKRNSAEARHTLQKRNRDDLLDQIEKCVIRAPRPGLVIYGTGEQRMRAETIEEGATVRERQTIITIPDTTAMSVRVQVHESFVKQVEAGQSARIRVDAYPEEQLTGTVHRISVLPDAQNRWLNPDLRVYSTLIHIDGEHDWLKPGMSAEVEIVADVISDAIQAPVHAVHIDNGVPVCYVQTHFGVERRPVRTGPFNVSFVQILEGLAPGDRILLRPPEGRRREEDAEEEWLEPFETDDDRPQEMEGPMPGNGRRPA